MQHERLNSDVLALLRRAAKDADVEVVWFEEFLCNTVLCQTYIDGVLIYRDTGHLTHQGSEFLAGKLGLKGQLERTAR